MTMQPALNVIGLKDGSQAQFGSGYQVLPIWKDRMDARAWVPTPNADVIYSMSYLDLKVTGPLVVNAPANVIGMFTDFFQRTITDVGAIGPDRARGGLYLLLPPDYDGEVPPEGYTFSSPTYNVFLFFRTIMGRGDAGRTRRRGGAGRANPGVSTRGRRRRRSRRWSSRTRSGQYGSMMYPDDIRYWTKLKEFVDYEPVYAIDPEVRGALASIGIIKG